MDWVGSRESEDTVRILVGTDQHIGHKDKDSVRHKDALNAFREFLRIAKAQRVDFVLLGGDLFDVNKPPRKQKYEVTRLLREFVLSDDEVKLEFLSDPSKNFQHSKFPRVNYLDPNLNVGLPIFSIHGNHDDMAGGELCALDEYHESGLLNLFGKIHNTEKIEVEPILLRKGRTRIALYGLGAQNDQRLNEAFCMRNKHEQVTFNRPTVDPDDWWNLFVLHQTRTDYARDSKRFISESVLPDFLHLTVWGHEHRCLINPLLDDDIREPKRLGGKVSTVERDSSKGWVMQPGSSVQTSLDKAEAGRKYVSLLEVNGTDWKHYPIELKTIRQFLVPEEDVVLRKAREQVEVRYIQGDRFKIQNEESAQNYCAKSVEKLVAEAKQSHNGIQPLLPLIRIRVDFAGMEDARFNVRVFGSRFVGKVANPTDLITAFTSEKQKRTRAIVDRQALENLQKREHMTSVEDFVNKYFEETAEKDRNKEDGGEAALSVLTPIACSRATNFFLSGEGDPLKCVAAILNKQEEKIVTLLADQMDENMTEEDMQQRINELRERRYELEQQARNPTQQQPLAQQNDHPDPLNSSNPDRLNLTLDQLNITEAEVEQVLAGPGLAQSREAPMASVSDFAAPVATSSRTYTRGRGRGRGSSSRSQRGGMEQFLPPASASTPKPPATQKTQGQKRQDVAEFGGGSRSKRATPADEENDEDDFANITAHLRSQNKTPRLN